MTNEISDQANALIGTAKEASYIVTKRDIKRFAQAIGDDNPLYYDEEFAKASAYGSIIAPPLFCQAYTFEDLPISELPPDGSPSEIDVPVPAKRTVGGSSKYEFYEPVRPGDEIKVVTSLKAINKKTGRSGELYFVVVETQFFNQHNQQVAMEEATYVKKADEKTSES